MRFIQILKFPGNKPSTRIAFHPTKDHLAVVYGQDEIFVWDLSKARLVTTAKIDHTIIDLAFNLERLIITGRFANFSWKYLTEPPKTRYSFTGGDLLTVSDNGDWLACAANNLAPHPDDDILMIVSTKNFDPVSTFMVKDLQYIEPDELMFRQVLLSSSGKRAAFSCWSKNRLGGWNPYTSVIEVVDSGLKTLWWDLVESDLFSFGPDGETIALLEDSGSNLFVIKALNDRDDIYIDGVIPHVVSFHPDKPVIACGSDDNEVQLISIPSGDSIDNELLQTEVSSIAFNQSGNLLAAGDDSLPFRCC